MYSKHLPNIFSVTRLIEKNPIINVQRQAVISMLINAKNYIILNYDKANKNISFFYVNTNIIVCYVIYNI